MVRAGYKEKNMSKTNDTSEFRNLLVRRFALALLLSVAPLAGSLAQAQELHSKQLAAGSVAGQERENLGKRKLRGHLKIMTAPDFKRAPAQQKFALASILKSSSGGAPQHGNTIAEINLICNDWLVYWQEDENGDFIPGTAVVHCDGVDYPQ
jgi:hypothetical protein